MTKCGKSDTYRQLSLGTQTHSESCIFCPRPHRPSGTYGSSTNTRTKICHLLYLCWLNWKRFFRLFVFFFFWYLCLILMTAVTVDRSVPLEQRRSAGMGGSQVKVGLHLKTARGFGDRVESSQFNIINSPTLYCSLFGEKVIPSGISGGRQSFPAERSEVICPSKTNYKNNDDKNVLLHFIWGGLQVPSGRQLMYWKPSSSKPVKQCNSSLSPNS